MMLIVCHSLVEDVEPLSVIKLRQLGYPVYPHPNVRLRGLCCRTMVVVFAIAKATGPSTTEHVAFSTIRL